MGSLSIWHWLIVLLVVVLIFGTKKLRNMGSDLGGAWKGFKDGMKSEEELPNLIQGVAKPSKAESKQDAHQCIVGAHLYVWNRFSPVSLFMSLKNIIGGVLKRASRLCYGWC